MLDERDHAVIELAAMKAAEHVATKMEQQFEERLKRHQAECPFAKDYEANKNKAKGGWKVAALIGAWILAGLSLVASWFK
ncbi:MAG: hypothetical protein A2W31_06835 [Planctomycetes bacterium RBG_16_64_10]|nr:MAG: hypothetical protein A2W31_06835 [Planctomycetes bacterium RBG_16_64_10]